MKILYAGNNARGEICLRALVEHGYDVVGVLAYPKEEEEKGFFRSVRYEAQRLQLPIYKPRNPNSEGFREIIQKQVCADLMIMVGYGKLIKEKTFKLFPQGCWNIHASPLPYDRGPAPLNWAIIRGKNEWAVSLIDIDEGIDTGDILAQMSMHINEEDNIASVCDKVNSISSMLLLDTLEDLVQDRIHRTPQSPDFGSYNTKRRPGDGQIDWKNMNSKQIHNLVRALTRPYPGAFTWLDGEKVYVWKTYMVETLYRGIPGRVANKSDKGIIVIANDRGILITDASKASSDERINELLDNKAGLGSLIKVGTDLGA